MPHDIKYPKFPILSKINGNTLVDRVEKLRESKEGDIEFRKIIWDLSGREWIPWPLPNSLSENETNLLKVARTLNNSSKHERYETSAIDAGIERDYRRYKRQKKAQTKKNKRVKRSKAKQSKAKAKQSKAKPSKAKQSQAKPKPSKAKPKPSKAKQSKAKQSKAKPK